MSLNFAIVVSGPAYGTQAASSAYRFVQAVLASGHVILGVFFYQDGVMNASFLHSPATDEDDLHQLWCQLAIQEQIPLHTCIAAAQRRGSRRHRPRREQRRWTVTQRTGTHPDG